ncbi:MAG: hypothetical protein J7562_13610 [Agrobacterium tumefaciens]|nr:hypothetical protein [Agrobacterium tumefaciens]
MRGIFTPVHMAMIALAAFIVITQNAFPFYHQRQPIFEEMGATGNGLEKMPQDNLEKGRLVDHFARLFEQNGLHVVMHDNALTCCQRKQRSRSMCHDTRITILPI